jgi:hypothetical protein
LKKFLGPPPFPRRQYFAEKFFGFWKIFFGGGANFLFHPQTKNHLARPQNKEIQKCNFHYKTVRRFFTEIAGGHVLLASALKRGIHPLEY